MNKYELALVVSAKVEDEVRDAASLRKLKGLHRLVSTVLSQTLKNGVRRN